MSFRRGKRSSTPPQIMTVSTSIMSKGFEIAWLKKMFAMWRMGLAASVRASSTPSALSS